MAAMQIDKTSTSQETKTIKTYENDVLVDEIPLSDNPPNPFDTHLTEEQLKIVESELAGIITWSEEMRKVIALPVNQHEEAKKDADLIVRYHKSCSRLAELIKRCMEDPSPDNFLAMTDWCLLNSSLKLPGDGDGGAFFRFVWEASVGLRKFTE